MTLPFSYYNSRVEAAFMLALLLLFTGMFCRLLTLVVSKAEGSTWLFVPIFCLLLSVFIWLLAMLARRLFGKSPRLTLTQTGVTDHQLGIGEVLWADVEGAYLRFTKGNPVICLELRNEHEYVARLASATRFAHSFNKKLGFTPIVLSLNGVDANSTEILATIKSMAAQPH